MLFETEARHVRDCGHVLLVLTSRLRVPTPVNCPTTEEETLELHLIVSFPFFNHVESPSLLVLQLEQISLGR